MKKSPWLSSVVLLSRSLVCALCLRLYCDSDHSSNTPCAIVWHCLHDSTFSHFSRTLTCDRQTDRETHDYGIYHASMVKVKVKVGFLYSATYTANQNSTLHNLGSGS